MSEQSELRLFFLCDVYFDLTIYKFMDQKDLSKNRKVNF